MCADWDKQGIGRKAYSSQMLIPLHAACGGFLAFLQALQDKLPPDEFNKHEKGLRDQFMMGSLDPDIHQALSSTVPPASIDAVAFLRWALSSNCNSIFM